MSTLDNDNESPTVIHLKRELEHLHKRVTDVEFLFLNVVERYMTQEGGKYVGDFADEVNALTGRV